jgi:hypothetical protein
MPDDLLRNLQREPKLVEWNSHVEDLLCFSWILPPLLVMNMKNQLDRKRVRGFFLLRKNKAPAGCGDVWMRGSEHFDRMGD